MMADRFWAKVAMPAGPDACWEWTGWRDRAGYGRFSVEGRPRLAHRVSVQLAGRPIPAGLVVLHRCDNPPCVRPDHLVVGTLADNNRDCAAKGRHGAFVPTPPRGADWAAAHPRILRGEEIRQAKLREDDVRQIRAMRRAGQTLREIGDRFGVSQATVHRVVHRAGWAHVGEDAA